MHINTSCNLSSVNFAARCLHERARAVSVAPSVCPSRSCIVSKRVNICSNFSPWDIATLYSDFSVHLSLWQYSDGDWRKNRSRFSSNISPICGVSSFINKFKPRSLLITASVDFVYISRRSRRREENRIYLYASLNPKPSN